MRQYEKGDCLEEAIEGQVLNIGTANIPANPFGECDLVTVFGNPESNKVTWLPYNSIFKIENNLYKVIKGELSPFKGDRIDVYDQSSSCFINLQGKLNCMYDFIGKEAKVLAVCDQNDSNAIKEMYAGRLSIAEDAGKLTLVNDLKGILTLCEYDNEEKKFSKKTKWFSWLYNKLSFAKNS
tara:strand:- start:86348 stop:86890 length:543 start_codon:yes stop_codon:yes gene_type:complete